MVYPLFRFFVYRCFVSWLGLLLILSASCQRTDTYENWFEECLEGLETKEFEIVGSGQKGIAYSGFKVDCLEGAPLPVFQTVDMQGKEVSSSSLQGKITVMNFWFIHCTPCVKEIPDLNKLASKHGKSKVNFIAMGRDSGSDIRKFLKAKPFHFTQVPDAEEIIRERFNLMWGFPSTIVADEDGRIIKVFRGATLDTDSSVTVATAVDELLAELLSPDTK